MAGRFASPVMTTRGLAQTFSGLRLCGWWNLTSRPNRRTLHGYWLMNKPRAGADLLRSAIVRVFDAEAQTKDGLRHPAHENRAATVSALLTVGVVLG
jgi:hypothetical protein